MLLNQVLPKLATSTLMDGSGNMKDDAIVYEAASNNNKNDGVQKCISEEKDVEDSDIRENVGYDIIEDDISKTTISICGLEDCEESEDTCNVIEVDSFKKSYVGSLITLMTR
ncbi:unnamed protein product [Lactuca saligna]|uniref:Uncharacterized protein n=1 Tax=Lactuca saligna TaxID=75948 RepID=A0AA36DY62_LACSI|nr:unnamed protein product [Lactuca saligna]